MDLIITDILPDMNDTEVMVDKESCPRMQRMPKKVALIHVNLRTTV